jgi:hypothetical protein
LSRYTDVLAALHEPSLWPVGAHKTTNRKIPDDAARELLRRQILEAFSPSRLNEWQTRMQRAAGEIVVEYPLDLVADFIEPWCAAAAEIVTGSDPSERPALLAAARIVSDSAAEPKDEDLQSRASAANAELERYFAARSSIPMAGATFVAMARTLACLLANGWLGLLRQTHALAQLWQDAALIPKATEELLRYSCLPQAVFRRASQSVVLAGVKLGEGDRIVLRLASANRDPLQFSDPDRIDFTRRGAAGISLGFGPHSCVGAALIRMAATVATRVFVERFGAFELDGPVHWRGGDGFRSPATLRVRAATSRG